MTIPTLDEMTLLHEHCSAAMSDPRRLQILFALGEGPMNVTALAEALNAPQPTVSRHLAVLRGRSLVVTERSGASVIYRLADPRVIDVLTMMRQIAREGALHKANVLEESVS
jgi:ArsR family transcriptional regulator